MMPKSLSEKLVVTALAASLVGLMTGPVIAMWRAVVDHSHPIVSRYEGVYGRLRDMAERVGE